MNGIDSNVPIHGETSLSRGTFFARSEKISAFRANLARTAKLLAKPATFVNILSLQDVVATGCFSIKCVDFSGGAGAIALENRNNISVKFLKNQAVEP